MTVKETMCYSITIGEEDKCIRIHIQLPLEQNRKMVFVVGSSEFRINRKDLLEIQDCVNKAVKYNDSLEMEEAL